MDKKKNNNFFSGKKSKTSKDGNFSGYNNASKKGYYGPAGAYSEVMDALDSKKQTDIYKKGYSDPASSYSNQQTTNQQPNQYQSKQPNQYSNKQPNQYQSTQPNQNSNQQPIEYQGGGTATHNYSENGSGNYSNKHPNQYQSKQPNQYSNQQPNQYQNGGSQGNYNSPSSYSNKQGNKYQNGGMDSYNQAGDYSKTKVYPDSEPKSGGGNSRWGSSHSASDMDAPDPDVGGYGIKKTKYNNSTSNPKSPIKNYGQDKYGDDTLYGDDIEDRGSSKK